MHKITASETKDLDLYLQRLHQLNAVGASLSRERDINRLLEQILDTAKSITNADGGTIYRPTEDGKSLRFEILRNDRLGISMGGSSAKPIQFPDLPLNLENGEPNLSNVAAYSAIKHEVVNIADAYSAAGFDFTGTKLFDQRTGYRSQSFLTVPMKSHEGLTIGVLQLINAHDPITKIVQAFSATDQSLAESLAAQAEIALTNRLLMRQLEKLFESFIRLINLAIDEKSPYTGGHCQRVPALTMMIADAVHAMDVGPLADFHMSDKDRYELEIAGLLHDCGKVTTPVHVVDKATKLQTIFDRIHLVDTRIEVLKRDAEISAMRQILELRAPKDRAAEAKVWASMRSEINEMESDRKLLRTANKGAEFMPTEMQQKIQSIGTHRKWRNVEGVEADFLTANEIENLTIKAGTLTQSEREIINYHIVATIKMLEKLPWPKHLANVPEYAGGHHERMDGRGYPLGLTRDQMSVQARMMGIADIFEALTAGDRPYKDAMKLSEAMSILGKFSANGHIDPDIFSIFVSSKVYEQYAQKFLKPTQIDYVDISTLAGYKPITSTAT